MTLSTHMFSCTPLMFPSTNFLDLGLQHKSLVHFEFIVLSSNNCEFVLFYFICFGCPFFSSRLKMLFICKVWFSRFGWKLVGYRYGIMCISLQSCSVWMLLHFYSNHKRLHCQTHKHIWSQKHNTSQSLQLFFHFLLRMKPDTTLTQNF